MTTVTISIPLKKNSQRVNGKNFRDLGGVPLYMRALTKALKMKADGAVDEVAIFGSLSIREFIPTGVTWHREQEIVIRQCSNDLFSEMASACETDAMLVLNATSPFIGLDTIALAIEAVQSGEYDSALTAIGLRGRLWDDRKPLNHDPTICPRTQSQEPIWFESDGLWIASCHLFAHDHRRVGYKPLFIEVSGMEALDVDTEQDWQLCEIVAMAGGVPCG